MKRIHLALGVAFAVTLLATGRSTVSRAEEPAAVPEESDASAAESEALPENAKALPVGLTLSATSVSVGTKVKITLNAGAEPRSRTCKFYFIIGKETVSKLAKMHSTGVCVTAFSPAKRGHYSIVTTHKGKTWSAILDVK